MTPAMSKKAQTCLTVNDGIESRKIINVELLFSRHSTETVLRFLNRLLNEYEETLKRLITGDQTSPKIDDTAARMLRVLLAIRTIELENEEVLAA